MAVNQTSIASASGALFFPQCRTFQGTLSVSVFASDSNHILIFLSVFAIIETKQ